MREGRDAMLDVGIIGGLRFGAATDPVATAGLAEVRAYWEGLRVAGGIPPRSAIDPRGISGALDRVFLAERIGAGLAQIRLAGTVLNSLAGMDARGLPLSCLFQPAARPELAGIVGRVFDAPLAADLLLVAAPEPGRPQVQARLILLPLLDAGGICSLILGCFGLQGEVGRTAKRFAIGHSVEERLLLDPPGATPVPEATPDKGKHHAHLRLVYSAD